VRHHGQRTDDPELCAYTEFILAALQAVGKSRNRASRLELGEFPGREGDS
jgi:hypothetical protein